MPFQPLVRIILSVDPEQDDEIDAHGRPYLVLNADLSVGERVEGVTPTHIRDALEGIVRNLPFRLAEMWEIPVVMREPAEREPGREEFIEAFSEALTQFMDELEQAKGKGVRHDGRTEPVSDTGTARDPG